MSDDKISRWLIPLCTFIAGVVVTLSLMTPSIYTPEYQQGHAAGYKAGFDQKALDVNKAMDVIREHERKLCEESHASTP